MSPPGTTTTPEPTLEHIEREKVTDFSSTRGQLRYLMGELGVTRPQAKALIAAYAADMADVDRIGNDTGRSDEAFIDWLMRQAPGGRVRSVKKRGWRVAS